MLKTIPNNKMKKRKTLVSWSTGKDSAWALHVLQNDPSIDVVGLVCTTNEKFDRVAVHGVRIELLKQQAESANLPLYTIPIPYPCNNDEYVSAMKSFISDAKKQGVEHLAFGDLFLRDVRSYRENLLKETGITPLFPIWGCSTKMLSKQMISSGLKAIITCINPKQIAKEFVGREFNESFLNDIPENVDPCGENGEFHSFAFEGPMFQNPIKVILGETVFRDDVYFADLLPWNKQMNN